MDCLILPDLLLQIVTETLNGLTKSIDEMAAISEKAMSIAASGAQVSFSCMTDQLYNVVKAMPNFVKAMDCVNYL